MKKNILLVLGTLALLATLPARAWTYTNGDLLLIFRDGHNNVEFDLGSVTNFLGHTNGYTTPVTGWNPNIVNATFPSLSGVKVVLLASSGQTDPNPTAWLSSAEPNTTAYTVSAQGWSRFYGIVSALGTRPLFYGVPAAETNAYALASSSLASYDYIVSGGTSSGTLALPLLGGNAPFTVEQAIPGLLDFWSIQPSSANPKPPDHLVGTFYLTSGGVLTFVAGPRPSTIVGLSRSGTVSTVQFTTTVGNTYALSYTNSLGGPAATWPVDASTLVGDGNINSISHTTVAGDAEFYRVGVQ